MALSDYFDDTETIRTWAEDADADTDAVSIEYLLPTPSGDTPMERADMALSGEPIEGALVFIKGDETVREFIAWARERHLLHRKPWHAGERLKD